MQDRAPRSSGPEGSPESEGLFASRAGGAGIEEEARRSIEERLDRILAYCQVELMLAEPGDLQALLNDETGELQGSPVPEDRAGRIDAALASLSRTLEATPVVQSVVESYHAVAAASDSSESRAVAHAHPGPQQDDDAAESFVTSWAIPVHRRLDESLFYECAHCGFLVGEGVAICPACRAAFDPLPGRDGPAALAVAPRPVPPPPPEPLGRVRWKQLRNRSSPG